ncbi:SU(VAR)3-9 homolog 1 [Actinidia rufa]|uniref:SU(VAR)3-9 homolog 1 n=1 Tax=Actinidia rufa TaxID=165716 RepID=A0A7J0GF17_9ERIC|nr:SU(VAR)3-9 homolog 1 [Actinidia rufa]
MEQGLGSESIPASGSVDKSRVLTVRPLRSLVPIFPSPPGMSSISSPQASPFVCVPPTGPFPPGVAHFSLLTPTLHYSGAANGNTSRNSSRSRTAGVQSQPDDDGYSESQNQSDPYLNSFSMHVTSAENTSKSGRKKGNSQRKTRSGREDKMSARDVDIDLLRRRITQIEDSKDATPGVTRRPDLRAGTILMNKGVRTNVTKRVGAVPGVEVGDIFFFRMELCLVGLHAPSMAGIDYMSLKISLDEEPVAVSIVSSGSYEDNVEDGDFLIYSGQGGVLRRDKNVMDQKLERGNLALEKSLYRGNEVRVIRGMKDEANQSGKVYVYDGLYKIQESWTEKGKSGCNVFKYKLIRAAGQADAFTLWKSIQQWKQDHEKGPAYFTYLPSLKYSKPTDSQQPSLSCTCRGLKVRLEVFRTKDKGWGLRSWDPIRAGAFICEYAGEAIDKSTEKEFGSESEDYIFDATRTFEPLEIMPGNSDDSQKIPFPLVISAKNDGNVSRFMNHSCTPKVYWQPVLREESYLHIAFFAISHIPPMQELTYDYGTVRSGKAEPRRKKCRCESPKCRGYFY